MNIVEQLASIFGEDSKNFDGYNNWAFGTFGELEVTGPKLAAESNGALQWSCGNGKVLFSFHRVDKMKGCFCVVYNDSESRAWHLARSRGDTSIATRCPSPVMSLCFSM